MKFVKSALGQRVMKDRSVALTPRQRAAFILFDGRNTVDQVLAATGAAGVSRQDIDHLAGLGLLEPAAEAAAPPAEAAAATPEVSARSPQQRYQEAYPVAARLTSGLGLKGFRLNLAVEHATNYEELRELAPRIRDAVGAQAFGELDRALNA